MRLYLAVHFALVSSYEALMLQHENMRHVFDINLKLIGLCLQIIFINIFFTWNKRHAGINFDIQNTVLRPEEKCKTCLNPISTPQLK